MHSINLLLLVAVVYVSASSWDDFLKIKAPGLKAVEFDLKDGSIIASSTGFKPTVAELKKISQQFSDPSDIKEHGITIGGTKYDGVKGDENKLYGKKGSDGVIVAKNRHPSDGIQDAFAGVYGSKISSDKADAYMENILNSV